MLHYLPPSRQFGSEFIIFVVGTSAQAFHVHKAKVDNFLLHFQGLIEQKLPNQDERILLPHQDADSFGLLVEWLYGVSLSLTAKRLHTGIDQTMTLIGTAFTYAPINFFVVLISEICEVGSDCEAVTGQTPRSLTTPEEVTTNQNLRTTKQQGDAVPRSQQATPEQTCVRQKEREKLQLALIKLLSFAHELKWDALFSDCMDAYRSGEESMRRKTPLQTHLDTVFHNTFQSVAPLHRFMADYTFFTGVRYKTRHMWVAPGIKHPGLLAALMRRENGHPKVPGVDSMVQAGSPLTYDGMGYTVYLRLPLNLGCGKSGEGSVVQGSQKKRRLED